MSSSSGHYSHSVSHRLLIQLGEAYFAYQILDKNSKPIFGKEFTFDASPQLKQHILEDDHLKEAFARTDVIFTEVDYVLIPQTYALAGRMELYRLNFPFDGMSQLMRHVGTIWDADFCFSVSAELWNVLKENFPVFEHRLDVELMANWLLKDAPVNEGYTLAVYHRKQKMHLLLLNGHRSFELVNAYAFSNTEEWFYYVMLVGDQLGIKGEECSLVLLGSHEMNEAGMELCKDYFRDIKAMDQLQQHEGVQGPVKESLPIQILSNL